MMPRVVLSVLLAAAVHASSDEDGAAAAAPDVLRHHISSARQLQATQTCPAGTVAAYADQALTFRFQSDSITRNASGSLLWPASYPADGSLAFTVTRPDDELAYTQFSTTRLPTAPETDYTQWLGDFVEPLQTMPPGAPPGLLFQHDGVDETGHVDDGVGDSWKQAMYANQKIAVGAAHTLFSIVTPAVTTALYGTILGFRPGDAPGVNSYMLG